MKKEGMCFDPMNIIKDVIDGLRFFGTKQLSHSRIRILTSLPDDFETSGIGREEHMKAILDEVVKQLKSTEN